MKIYKKKVEEGEYFDSGISILSKNNRKISITLVLRKKANTIITFQQ